MEEQLTLIQYQLWAVIALLAAFVITNIFCYYAKKTEAPEPDFSVLWDKGEIEELLLKAKKHLVSFPNNTSALYFYSRALITKEQYNEAKELLEKLLINEPTLKNDIQEILNSISEHTS